MPHYFSRFNMEHIHEELGRLLNFINDLLDQLEKSTNECVREIRELESSNKFKEKDINND